MARSCVARMDWGGGGGGGGGGGVGCPPGFPPPPPPRYLLANGGEAVGVSRCGWRPVTAAPKAAGLWGHTTVAMAIVTVPHGVGQEDTRCRQVAYCVEEMMFCEALDQHEPFSHIWRRARSSSRAR